MVTFTCNDFLFSLFIISAIFAELGEFVPPSFDMKKVVEQGILEKLGEEASKQFFSLLDSFECSNVGVLGGMDWVNFIQESLIRIQAFLNDDEADARAAGMLNFYYISRVASATVKHINVVIIIFHVDELVGGLMGMVEHIF